MVFSPFLHKVVCSSNLGCGISSCRVKNQMKIKIPKSSQFSKDQIPLQFIYQFFKAKQGPLITDGRNSCKWIGPTVGFSKSFIRVKISGQHF
jgi:hypothetical protein